MKLLLAKAFLATSGIGNGTMGETMNAFSPVFDKLKPLFSAGINLIGFGLTVFCVVKAVLAGIAMSQVQNPNEKNAKKQELIGNLIGAALAVCLAIIINVLLASFGVTQIGVQ